MAHKLSIRLVVSGLPIDGMVFFSMMVKQFVSRWFLAFVPVRVQDSRCMGLRQICWVFRSLPVVAWPVVSGMPIHDRFLDVYHVYSGLI
jgi:hypothetical protein